MDSQSYTRAALSAAVFVGVAYVTSGGSAGMMDYAAEGVIQGVSAFASDVVHDFAAMPPTWLTSGAVTGIIAAGAKYYLRGDSNNFLVNAGGSAAVDVLTDQVHARLFAPSGSMEMLAE